MLQQDFLQEPNEHGSKFIEDLKQVLDNGMLEAKDATFAASLLDQYQKKGGLSERQWPWVKTLTLRGLQGAPVKQQVQLGGDFGKVIAVFKQANTKLKRPKLHFTYEGFDVSLSLAGENAKKPGTINVTDGKPYGSNKWFGRIDQSGSWEKSLRSNDSDLARVEDLLHKLEQDMVGAIASYGRLTGCCAFCNKTLTDEKSVAVGFGPICAKKWGFYEQWKNILKGSMH